jgi:protein-disulfide isomerase
VPVLEQVLEKYPEDVKLVFKNLPLKNHRYAQPAAAAALAAHQQGKFWEFHDELFANYSRLNDDTIKEIAVLVDLNIPDFEASLQDPEIQAAIAQDVKDAVAAGVRGTPTLFINGKQLRDRSMSGFQAAIEKELRK